MRTRLLATALFTLTATVGAAGTSALLAQESKPARPIISIGDYPAVNGLRINFRDSDLQRVNGVNLTAWSPHEPASGTVRGLALGLPLTGAADIDGIATGVFGVGASGHLRGITLGPIGAGAGGEISGVAVGGIGIGAGGNLNGIIIGGVGAGSGGDAAGLLVGGVGAGVGGNLRGIAFGGVGVGAGGNLRGFALGGVGVGAGGDLRGVFIGGVGAGAGGELSGLALGGIGVGAGARIHGIAIAGVGVGAPRLAGGFAALAVGAEHASGVVLAPAVFKIERGGSFHGGAVSAVNYIRGSQTGITIGLVNYTRTLNGVQFGLINIVADATAHRVLPILNWGGGGK
jgi:hypothetical protein